MVLLLQRVSQAEVKVGAVSIAKIGLGLLVFAGVEFQDTRSNIPRMAERLLGYRVFPDAEGKMNFSVMDVDAEVLLVPQFTLAADTHRGRRPSFTAAAEPAAAEILFGALADETRKIYPKLDLGVFAADMQVSLTNEGPVTFLLRG